LSFSKTFGTMHDLKILMGHTAERRDGWMSRATITNYDIPNDESYWRLNFEDTSRGQQNFRDPIENYFRRESYFARVNYKLLDRYLVNATIRRDANSNFPATNRWANFPSIGLGWILSQENFMQSVSFVDELKIRASYGLVGNDVIRPGQFDLRPTERLFTYFGTDRIDGATVTGIIDPNLKWEVVTEYDFGIEFSLLKQRFAGEIDFYHKKANDALYTIPYASIGFGNSLLTNAADVINSGVELGLKYRLPVQNEITQVISTTFTYNKNKVDNVGLGRALNFGSLGNGSTATQTLQGYEIGSFWVYRTDGIFQNEEEIKSYPHIINTKPGDLRLKDLNNDGIIDNLDREHIGSYQPKFIIGLNYAVSWKNWDASIDLFSLLGSKVYNAKKGIRFGSNYNVELEVAKNRWVPGSNENKNPRASNSTPYPSDYFVESGSFFRINNVTIGYKLEAGKFWNAIEQFRLFVGAQNPLLLTKYTGFTPELPGNQNESGIELNIYPVSAVFLFGLNVTFK
ncbi:MAG TPA: TonB-dependent receptor, partial [Saprospiraceae bacterium]|nr:TonB-dependent receptor [Saprospiraceae bacterium]